MTTEPRVLVVDDNDATRYALRKRLGRHGYHMLEAATGGDGLALIAAEPLDALILDVNLPDMSGFDIVRQLRAQPATALLPVIHVSAASILTGDIITGLNAGADAYLVHPVDPDVLLATLRTLLRVRDAERALRDSELRFSEIFTRVSAPIAVLDASLTVQTCNLAFAELLGNGQGQPLAGLFGSDQQAGLDALRLHLERGERWRGSLVMNLHGQVRETLWQLSPYLPEGHSLAFVEDISEQRSRERDHQAHLDSAQAQLAHAVAERERTEAQLLQMQKMDALGRLTGGIAHDFNNLLTGIIASLELTKKRLAEGSTAKLGVYTDAALSSATSAAGLTRRLLAFSRQQPLDTRPVDVNEKVHSLHDLLGRTIGEHVRLELELSSGPAMALVDPAQLESAVLNLVINARDALPNGGHIWLRSYAAWAQGEPNLQDGAYVALAVRDDGVGIEPATLAKVFDPFFTTKPLGQGTGLGLSIIYGFARQSGGDVSIRSVPGVGTEVTLLLPAATGGAEPLASEEATLTPGAGEHVLLVEDMHSVREALARVLVEAGYRCSSAEDAAGALALLQQGEPVDLLLCDLGLPVVPGTELAALARQVQPELKLVFMTGYAENHMDRVTFLEEGADLLFKPFRSAQLLGVLGRVFGRVV